MIPNLGQLLLVCGAVSIIVIAIVLFMIKIMKQDVQDDDY